MGGKSCLAFRILRFCEQHFRLSSTFSFWGAVRPWLQNRVSAKNNLESALFRNLSNSRFFVKLRMSKKGLSFRSDFSLNVPFFGDLLSRFAHDISVEIGKSCRTEKGNGSRNKWRLG